MANLNGLNIDPSVEENSGEFTVLPAGKYNGCIVKDSLGDNKNNTGKVLTLAIQIIEGQFSGEIIKDYINITNPHPTSQAIGQGTLKRICNLCGVPFPPSDTAGLMGKAMEIDVKVETFTSNKSGKDLQSNKIKSYGPARKKEAQQTPNQQTEVHQNSSW